MNIRRLALAVLVVWLVTPTLASAEYYIYQEGSNYLQKVDQNNADQLHPDEWQIWLYKRNETTGGRDFWGLISEQSPEAATANLKHNQDFELLFDRWLHVGNNFEVLTYFNPLGPIAVFHKTGLTAQAAAAFKAVGDMYKNIQMARKSYQDAAALVINGGDPKVDNPFSNVGKVLLDYGKALDNAAHKVSEARERIEDLQSPPFDQIESALNGIAADLNASENAFQTTDASANNDEGSSSAANLDPGTAGEPGGSYVRDGEQLTEVDSDNGTTLTDDTRWPDEEDIESVPLAKIQTDMAGDDESGGAYVDLYCIDNSNCITGTRDTGVLQIHFSSLAAAEYFYVHHNPILPDDTSSQQDQLSTTALSNGTKITADSSGNAVNGRIDFPDGSVYYGNISKQTQNGTGILVQPGGLIYQGDFVNGAETGKASVRYPDGSSYEGDIVNGLASGNGDLTRPDGSEASGAFSNNSLVTRDTSVFSLPIIPQALTIGKSPLPPATSPNLVAIPFPFLSQHLPVQILHVPIAIAPSALPSPSAPSPSLPTPYWPTALVWGSDNSGIGWSMATGSTIEDADQKGLSDCRAKYRSCSIAPISLTGKTHQCIAVAKSSNGPYASIGDADENTGTGLYDDTTDTKVLSYCENAGAAGCVLVDEFCNER